MPYRFNPFTGTLDYYQKASTKEYAEAVPLKLTTGQTFTIPTNKQVIIGTVITVDLGAEVVIAQGAELIKAGFGSE